MDDVCLAKPLPGWDTALAEPFDSIEALPRIFTAAHRVEAFSAVDEVAKYWLIREPEDKLWLYRRDHVSSEITRHYFQPDWTLRGAPVQRAIIAVTNLIRDRKAAAELSLDSSQFKQDVDLLRSQVGLLDPSDQFRVSQTELQALRYLSLALGVTGDVKAYVHERIQLYGTGGHVLLRKPFPAGISSITPALEVFLHGGNLYQLRSPCIELGPVESSRSPIDQMKAYRRLFDAGLSEDVAKSIDDYVAALPWSPRSQ